MKHILDTYCDSDVSCFKSVKVRFAKPVVPGQTIQTNMWLEGNRVYFECKVLETNTVVINGAYADLNSVKGAAPAPAASKPVIDYFCLTYCRNYFNLNYLTRKLVQHLR